MTYAPVYMIMDLETTTVSRYKRKASPFITDNWCVAEGWKVQGDEQCSWRYMDEDTSRASFLKIPDNVGVLVGHNIKFDMLWELSRTNTDLEKFLKRGGRIFCTQYAEYLIKAQHVAWQMCSLNDLSIAYGGTPKIDVVKAMWEDGVNTPDIPQDLLIDYLVGTEAEGRNGGDIGNTENIYTKQMELLSSNGMLTMVLDRMEGLLATTFMEFAGLKVDKVFARKYTIDQNKKLLSASQELQKFVPELPLELVFNWNSNVHKSCLIFGGAVKYTKSLPYLDDKTGLYARLKVVEKWPLFNGDAVDPKGVQILEDGSYVVSGVMPQDRFLSGKRIGEPKFKNVTVQGAKKTRKTDLHFTFDGYTKPERKWVGALTDALGQPTFSVGEKVMDALELRTSVPFIAALASHAALSKEIGTYLVAVHPKTGQKKGMLTCVEPKSMLIHHKLNHTSTVTSRLSSSDPNLQNLVRGDYNADTDTWKSQVKKLFISRFEGGRMVEADYSQLEVVVQGVLTEDPQLQQDLIDQIDFHCKRVASAHGCTYEQALDRCKNSNHPNYSKWSVLRTGAKIFSFQRAYGAGVSTISEGTGMSKEDVEALVALEKLTYPRVEIYYEEVYEAICDTAESFRAQRDDGSWGYYRRGYYNSPTGTKYSWRSYDAPAFSGVLEQFAQPEIKNYPVQGTGGEFVQCILGLLIRHLIKVDFYGGGMYGPSVVLCNTVHDCVWLDCKRDLASVVWQDIKPIMESIPAYYNQHYGMTIKVPFPVDGEYGLDMNNLGHFS